LLFRSVLLSRKDGLNKEVPLCYTELCFEWLWWTFMHAIYA